jgi:putative transposase
MRVRCWKATSRSKEKKAALTFMKKALKRHGSPEAITTDGLRSYRAAMNELGNGEKQEVGRWPTTGWRPRTCRSDDESARCPASGR